MTPISLSFDVTDALPLEVTEGQRISIAAWLFIPEDRAQLGAKPVTMVLLSGGSYDKRYFHAEFPGCSGYSAAAYLASRGNIVLIPDHLGIGESSRAPNQRKATRHIVAQANHAAVSQFYAHLASGDLHETLPPLAHFLKVGGGHSMGGMQTIVQQAAHRTYDAVMILGYTAQGVHLAMRGNKLRAADFIPPGDAPDYTANDRAPMRETFHWDDVPASLIAADDAQAVETPSHIGLDSIRTAIVIEDAATISVPIYLGLGERDVSPDPHAEPQYFRRCPDFTLHILPRAGHCHNFAGTRQLMWNRMHDWARAIQIQSICLE